MNWIDSIIEEHNKKLEATGWKGDWKDNNGAALEDPVEIIEDIL